MCIICSLSWTSLSLIRGSCFHKELRKDMFQFWRLRHKMGCWQFLMDFVNFDNICHVILKKKLFLSGVIVSVNTWRKDFRVPFVFRPLCRKVYRECTKYGNNLFSYFDILIYVSSNFPLDSKITEYLQCHIGLQLHTCFINFCLVKFQENWEKEF